MVPQATYVFVFLRVEVHGPQLAVFEMRKLPGAGSDLPVEFFATDLYFFSCDDFDNFPCERGPFLFELFYGLVRNGLYRPLILRSLAPHPVQPNGQIARHRLEEVAAVRLIVGNQDFHPVEITNPRPSRPRQSALRFYTGPAGCLKPGTSCSEL